MASIGKKYFQFGNYSDWTKCKNGYYLRTFSGNINSDALKFLKAHFLRLTSPLNYILTPKKVLQVNYIKIPKNDVGELKELQAYAMEQFKIIYGKVYTDYLSMLMLPSKSLINNPGNKAIDVDYGFHIKGLTSKATSSSPKTTITKRITSKSTIGFYAKNIFQTLLENGKLTYTMITNLMNKDCCSREIGISYSIIVINTSKTYDHQRYYKILILGKYLICSQWKEKNRVKLNAWLAANGL